MKVLIDENLPVRLRTFIPVHAVSTVTWLKWKGTRNGALLARCVENAFNVLVTIDGKLESQQNTAKAALGIVVLHAPSNTLDALMPLVDELVRTINRIKPGQVIHIPPQS
jgi:hypothetical protein